MVEGISSSSGPWPHRMSEDAPIPLIALPRRHWCAGCLTEVGEAMRCGSCQSAWFCNRDCQKRGHKYHKADCQRPLSAEEQGLLLDSQGVEGLSSALNVITRPAARSTDEIFDALRHLRSFLASSPESADILTQTGDLVPAVSALLAPPHEQRVRFCALAMFTSLTTVHTSRSIDICSTKSSRIVSIGNRRMSRT